ncbi:MAG: Mpo1-like protein [Candidatus Sericytochromatia bacterium]
MPDRIGSYAQFWPYYVSQHRDVTCRRLHVVGTTLVIGALALAVATRSPWWALAAPLFGYGPAWIGHFVFEHNRPATFDYLWWSLRGDFHMVWCTLTGQMAHELERAERAYPAS